MSDEITKSNPDKTNISEAKSRRRSERVVLRVPLSLSAVMPDGRRISVQVQSLVVNAHGGLLDVGMEMIRGQKIYLGNVRAELFVTGKVLRVEGSEDGHFSVAFEFESACPNFWPVSFPPTDWALVE